MKTSTLAVILSVLSLGSVAALYVKVDDLSGQIRRSRADRDPDVRNAADSRRPEYVIRKSNGGTAQASAEPSGAAPAGRAPRAGGEQPVATVEERLARLEEREEERAKRGEDLDGRMVYRVPKFARDVDDLASQLKLTSTQKDRVQDAIRRGKARIDEILSIPGADGKTIKDVRAERQRKLLAAMQNPEKNAGQMVALTLSGQSRLDERIPGRSETYRKEIERIQGETRNEIKGALDAEQGEKFDDMEIDHLIGGSGERVAISVGTTMVGPVTEIESEDAPAGTESGKKE